MATRRRGRRHQWGEGDVFVVTLLDGSVALGQVIARELDALNSVAIALFTERADSPASAIAVDSLPHSKAMSILLTTHDLLDRGQWSVLKKLPLQVDVAQAPYEETREAGFVGATIFGSGIVVDFLNAYFALAPWNDFKDPDYLDGLLLSPAMKPKFLMLKPRP